MPDLPHSSEIIRFDLERSRHESFFGREDVLREIDRRLASIARRGYVLITGGPGMGKSAILSRWLDLRERLGERVPHHFLRRGVADWDQPTAVVRNLAAQIEEIYPEQRQREALPQRRLGDLLARVSKEVLVPCGGRLVLLLDGLEETDGIGGSENPLERFVPYALPAGVFVLCASRPVYPHLGWLEARDGLCRVDLDDPAWANSNRVACSSFWEFHAPRLPLTPEFIAEAVKRSEGNLLYAVKLLERLHDLPPDRWQVEHIPRGLQGFLEQIWQQLRALPPPAQAPILAGLGLLCAAREPLHLSVLEDILSWSGTQEREHLLGTMRAALLEEPIPGSSEVAYRLFHESFREFLIGKLGERVWRRHHETLAQHLASWPPRGDSADPFRRGYALKHGVMHRVKAGDWRGARRMICDAGFMKAKAAALGVDALERDLKLVALSSAQGQEDMWILRQALRAESHWVLQSPEALPELLYNYLINLGWSAARIHGTLRLPEIDLRLRYPLQRQEQSERTLTGHGGSVTACCVTSDGKMLVSGSWDRTVKVWDLINGRQLLSLIGHTGPVTACVLTPDERRIISASDDETIRVWDLADGRPLAILRGHRSEVKDCAVAVDGARLISASWDGTLCVWDVSTWQKVSTLTGPADRMNACSISADGRLAISGSDDGTVRVWDLATETCVFTRGGHEGRIRACVLTSDGRRAISGSDDGTVRVWDLARRESVLLLHGHAGVVNACAVTEDERWVIAGYEDGTLRVWDAATGAQLLTLRGHTGPVGSCVVTKDGRRVVSGADDQTVKVWKLALSGHTRTPAGHTDWVTACAVSADGTRVVSGSTDGSLKLWDAESGRELITLRGHEGRVTTCALTADGSRALSGSSDGTLKLWDAKSGRELVLVRVHEDQVTACAVTPDGRWGISGDSDGTLKIWDLLDGREHHALSGHEDCVRACVVSADGSRLVSAANDGTLKVWDIASGHALCTLKGHASSVGACAVTIDGMRVLSGADDGILKVWDLVPGSELCTWAGHKSWINAAVFTADGRRAISGSWDSTLRLWDVPTRDCQAVLHGSSAFLCVSIHGHRVYAGDTAGNLWMLELSPGESVPAAPRRTRLFLGHAPEDRAYLDELESHLSPMVQNGLLETWSEREVAPGADRGAVTSQRLRDADIMVLLISSDFLASPSSQAITRQALARPEAILIPVLLRPVDFAQSTLGHLQVQPRSGLPITSFLNRDDAWVEVVRAIRTSLVEDR